MDKKLDVYYTKEGDTWDKIAYNVYNDELLYIDLMLANVLLIDIAVLDANIPVICPDIKPTNNANLPPWKQ